MGGSKKFHPLVCPPKGQQFSEINAKMACDPVRSLLFRTATRPYVDRELMMTVHAPKLLTPEEFASLIEIAIASDNPTVPPHHMSKLIGLGYVLETAKGPRVTGDGLIRITESE
jgi:hypothetical protein